MIDTTDIALSHKSIDNQKMHPIIYIKSHIILLLKISIFVFGTYILFDNEFRITILNCTRFNLLEKCRDIFLIKIFACVDLFSLVALNKIIPFSATA